MTEASRWSVTVLLGSNWAALRDHNTRWKRVVQHWAQRPDVSAVFVVDPPGWSWKRALVPGPLVEEQESWDPRIRSLRLTLPLRQNPDPWDPLLLRRVGSQLRRSTPAGRTARLVVAANPLVMPLTLRLRADRVGFDAVDDWRDFEPERHHLARVHKGYAAAASAHRITAVTRALADRLAHVGVQALPVPNGAPDWPVALITGPAPPGLPAGRFAVYVGNIETRMDVAAIQDLRRQRPDLPVVMAGRAEEGIGRALAELGVQLLGPVDPALVPGLLGRAAVGLVPHRAGGLSATQSSMKLLEYLAAGVPVATTVAPEDELPGVYTAGRDESFGALVDRVLGTARKPVAVGGLRRWQDVADELWAAYTS